MLPLRSLALALLVSASAAGCYRGTAEDAELGVIRNDSGWVRVDVPLVRQNGSKDCGAAALASVLGYWGRPVEAAEIDRATGRTAGRRVSAGELATYAQERGLSAYVFFGNFEDLAHELDNGRPVIVGVAKQYAPKQALAHYEVVVGYHRESRRVLTLDPAEGFRENSMQGFLSEWGPTGRVTLVTFEPPA